MLAAAQRLRRRGDFAATVRAGRRAGRGVIVVHLENSPTRTETLPVAVRVGFVVPKTVGIAVTRNKVRRRLQHLVAGRLGGLPAGTDLVVRALPGAADRSYLELGVDLDAALAAARRRGPRARGRT